MKLNWNFSSERIPKNMSTLRQNFENKNTLWSYKRVNTSTCANISKRSSLRNIVTWIKTQGMKGKTCEGRRQTLFWSAVLGGKLVVAVNHEIFSASALADLVWRRRQVCLRSRQRAPGRSVPTPPQSAPSTSKVIRQQWAKDHSHTDLKWARDNM